MNELVQYERQFDGIAGSAEPFPVNFDEAWQWVGYSTKGNALRILRDNFKFETDYLSILINRSDGKAGKPYTAYFLTVDCFKAFCMMSGTEKGKEVRLYYLAIEKKYHELRQTLISKIEQENERLKLDYWGVCNVYRQNAGYRMKYINLLDELERKGMKTEEIWRLSQADNHK